MMTHTMRGNREESARSPIGVGSLSLTKTDHARDVKWKDVPEPGHVER